MYATAIPVRTRVASPPAALSMNDASSRGYAIWTAVVANNSAPSATTPRHCGTT
jgi:hypothetical protein